MFFTNCNVSNEQTAWGPDRLKISIEATDSHQPVTVSVLPMFHIFAMNVTIGPVLYNGGKMVVMPKFEPQSFIAALEKYKVVKGNCATELNFLAPIHVLQSTFLHVAPPLLAFLVASPAVTPQLVGDMRDVLAAAAPMDYRCRR